MVGKSVSPEVQERKEWEKAVEYYCKMMNENADSVFESEKFVGMSPEEIIELTKIQGVGIYCPHSSLYCPNASQCELSELCEEGREELRQQEENEAFLRGE